MDKLEDSSCLELPDDLKEEILKWLPVESLCRFRSVCQQWNGLFQSTHFITTQWADFQKPWLVVCDVDTTNRCWAYCFFTGMWKPYFSLSSLNKMYHEGYYQGSTAGLLFGEMLYYPKGSVQSAFSICKDLIVFNPLAGRSVILPQPSSPRLVVAKGIVAGECEGNRQTYKVVVVRNITDVAGETNPGLQKVEIYDSSEKSWSMESYIPQNLRVIGFRMVFSDGYFYCKAIFYLGQQDIVGRHGIVGLSLQNGSSFFAPFPGFPYGNLCYDLVACGSLILLAGCVVEDNGRILKEVIIWELVKVKLDSGFNVSWSEIARMPPLMCEDVRRVWRLNRWFEFVGVGDCVCFRGRGSMEVAVYSLPAKSWSWLPTCPIQNHSRASNSTWIYSFEPRPDMKAN